MSHFASENDRVLSLLAEAASVGIDARSADELAALLGDEAGAEIEAMELAAAALDVAMVEQSGGVSSLEAMPAAVMASIASEAGRFVGSKAEAPAASLRLSRREDDAVIARAPAAVVATVGRGAGGSGGAAWLGWLAAAAGIAIAASAWLPRLSTTGGRGTGAGAVANAALSIDDLKAAAGTIEIAWKPLPDETCKEKCAGRVVWNNDLQQGYMTFKGLAVNDPSKFQYQLWVFDGAQKHPVDGGVFDIPAGAVAKAGADGEVIVPVVAKIRVETPQAFAVTIEKPGGVVVSDQSRIATLAPVSKG